MDERNLHCTERLIDFIADSPVSYLVVRNAVRMLEENGYRPYRFGDNLENSGKYYITRNGSSVLAFRLTASLPNGFMVTASHSDSPLFMLKPDYTVKACDRYCKLNTEVYGGGIYSSWFDRPLSIAGRAVVRDAGSLKVLPFSIDRDLCLIPNTCIHFNREINSGYTYNPAVDTLPLLCEWTEKPVLPELIANTVGVRTDDIVSSDLYLYNRMRGTIFGADNAFFAAPRIDDQQCAFTTLTAFIETEETSGSIPICAIFDNEEVGSSTKQGAASDLLCNTLEVIAAHYGVSLASLLPSSLLLSCDNAHAMHPNHPELSDKQNAPHMNAGVVIKHNANQKYTTDAVSEALFTEICRQANVPVQHFANRSDIRGGSTLGSIASARVSMNAVDIGLAQLAMHSSYETAGTRDSVYMIDACKTFFTRSVLCTADGTYRLE